MAIRLPSHLHRARSGVLHFRITIPPDVRHHFSIREIYRSLRTANVRDATPAAQAFSQAAKRLFHQLRSRTMSDQKKTPQGPFDGFEMGLTMELHFDELMPSRKVVKIQTEPGDTPELLAAALAGMHGNAAGAGGRSLAPVANAEPISSYVEPYLDSIPPDQRPNPKTTESYRAGIHTFIKIIGDKPLQELNRFDANRFEDVIVKLPVNSTKLAATKSLSIDEMTELGLPPISLVNAKNIARRTNKFLKWAFRRQGIEVPFDLMDEVRVMKKGKGENKRRSFTDDELRLIFNSEMLGTGPQASPYMFWVPLIGAHSGMRINEIAQLSLSDIVERDGIPSFNVTDLPDSHDEDDGSVRAKSVKTEAGKRTVPIHSKLIGLGLLQYADKLKQAGHTRLFPELEGGRDGPGQPASKQFGRYCDRIKLSDEKVVFHSFRHGAVSRMRQADVPKELRKIVVGHSAIEDTHDGYGEIDQDYSSARKQEAIEALKFDGIIDYAALKQRAPMLDDLNKSLNRLEKRRS